MGPRSRDRGITLIGAVEIDCYLLQWGRGHVTAESRYQASIPSEPAFASMGPRSRDRGIEFDINRGEDGRMASMGPRSRDRGIMAQLETMRRHQIASMGPRSRDRGIERGEDRVGSRPHGFNGAAVT